MIRNQNHIREVREMPPHLKLKRMVNLKIILAFTTAAVCTMIVVSMASPRYVHFTSTTNTASTGDEVEIETETFPILLRAKRQEGEQPRTSALEETNSGSTREDTKHSELPPSPTENGTFEEHKPEVLGDMAVTTRASTAVSEAARFQTTQRNPVTVEATPIADLAQNENIGNSELSPRPTSRPTTVFQTPPDNVADEGRSTEVSTSTSAWEAKVNVPIQLVTNSKELNENRTVVLIGDQAEAKTTETTLTHIQDSSTIEAQTTKPNVETSKASESTEVATVSTQVIEASTSISTSVKDFTTVHHESTTVPLTTTSLPTTTNTSTAEKVSLPTTTDLTTPIKETTSIVNMLETKDTTTVTESTIVHNENTTLNPKETEIEDITTRTESIVDVLLVAHKPNSTETTEDIGTTSTAISTNADISRIIVEVTEVSIPIEEEETVSSAVDTRTTGIASTNTEASVSSHSVTDFPLAEVTETRLHQLDPRVDETSTDNSSVQGLLPNLEERNFTFPIVIPELNSKDMTDIENKVTLPPLDINSTDEVYEMENFPGSVEFSDTDSNKPVKNDVLSSATKIPTGKEIKLEKLPPNHAGVGRQPLPVEFPEAIVGQNLHTEVNEDTTTININLSEDYDLHVDVNDQNEFLPIFAWGIMDPSQEDWDGLSHTDEESQQVNDHSHLDVGPCVYAYHCGDGAICPSWQCPTGFYCCMSLMGFCCYDLSLHPDAVLAEQEAGIPNAGVPHSQLQEFSATESFVSHRSKRKEKSRSGKDRKHKRRRTTEPNIDVHKHKSFLHKRD